MSQLDNSFRINVGFIIAESIGYSREISFDMPRFHQEPDFSVQDVFGSLTFTRTSEGLLLQTHIDASLDLECVRCLDTFTLRIHSEFEELYTFPSHAKRDSDLILPPTGIINLGPLMREYMLLEIPIKPLCRVDCRGLCPICGENLNRVTCDHSQDVIDPRLALLKQLLEKPE